MQRVWLGSGGKICTRECRWGLSLSSQAPSSLRGYFPLGYKDSSRAKPFLAKPGIKLILHISTCLLFFLPWPLPPSKEPLGTKDMSLASRESVSQVRSCFILTVNMPTLLDVPIGELYLNTKVGGAIL